MAYGDKRDYRKIDIYLRRPHGLTYLASTTWASNLREARERYAATRPNDYGPSDLAAYYSTSA